MLSPLLQLMAPPIHRLGKFSVPFTTVEGHKRNVLFNNANVEFPILSTGRIADNDNEIWFGTSSGKIVSNSTGEVDCFIRALGVYWIQMVVDEELMTPGFVRQG